MRLVLIGCEYTGKRSLASLISRWIIDEMGPPIGKAAADLNAFRQGLLPYLDARDLDRLRRRRSEGRPTAAPAKPARSAAP